MTGVHSPETFDGNPQRLCPISPPVWIWDLAIPDEALQIDKRKTKEIKPSVRTRRFQNRYSDDLVVARSRSLVHQGSSS